MSWSNARHWSEDEDAVLLAHYADCGPAACALLLVGRSKQSVKCRARALGLNVTAHARREILAAASAGHEWIPPNLAKLGQSTKARAGVDQVIRAWTERRSGGAA